MFLFGNKTKMPDPSSALPGRDQPIPTAERRCRVPNQSLFGRQCGAGSDGRRCQQRKRGVMFHVRLPAGL